MAKEKGSRTQRKSHRFNLGRIGICLCLAWIVLAGNFRIAAAQEVWPEPSAVQANSYVVMDLHTGKVLLEKNSGERIYPASLTKILTATVALEYYKPDQIITVSKSAASLSSGESTIDLAEGETLPFSELLYGMLLSSGNDAAKALADAYPGGAAAFMAKMNEVSEDVGAKDSKWNNPQGVTAESHYSTSYDLALITRDAMKNETFRKVVSTKVYSMAPTNKHPYSGWNILENTNKLLRFQNDILNSSQIDWIDGVKTGTTAAAGSNLIASAHLANGLDVICVLNGVRKDDAKNLYSYTRTLLEEAARMTDGVQTIFTKGSPAKLSGSDVSCIPESSFALYISDSPAVSVSVQSEGDLLTVKSAENAILYSTAIVDSKESLPETSSEIASGSSSKPSDGNPSADSGSVSNLMILIGILSGAVIVLGIGLIASISRRSRDRQRNKIKRL